MKWQHINQRQVKNLHSVASYNRFDTPVLSNHNDDEKNIIGIEVRVLSVYIRPMYLGNACDTMDDVVGTLDGLIVVIEHECFIIYRQLASS